MGFQMTVDGDVTRTKRTHTEKMTNQDVQRFRDNVRPPKWHDALTGKYTWRNVGIVIDRPVRMALGPFCFLAGLFAAGHALSLAMIVYGLVMGYYLVLAVLSGSVLMFTTLPVLVWYSNMLDLKSAWLFASYEREKLLATDDDQLLRVLENDEDIRVSRDGEVIS